MNSELKTKLLSDEEPVEEALDTDEEINAIADLSYDYGIECICEPEESREKIAVAVSAGHMEPSVAVRLYCWSVGIGNSYVAKAAAICGLQRWSGSGSRT